MSIPFRSNLLLAFAGSLLFATGLHAVVFLQVESDGNLTNRSTHFAPGSTIRIHPDQNTPTDGPIYQWVHNGSPVSGAVERELELANLSSADSGNYRLQVTTGTRTEMSTNTIVINVVPPSPAIVDTSFSAAADTPRGTIVALRGDGTVFLRSGNSADPARLVTKLAPDGTLLHTTHLAADSGTVLAVLADDSIITATAPHHVAPDGVALSFSLPADFDAAQPLSEVRVATDGSFFVRQGDHLAHFQSDGSVDSGFEFSAPATAMLKGFDLDHLNRPLIRLRYPNPERPTDYTYGTDRTARLKVDGTVDPNFVGPRSQVLYSHLYLYPLNDGRCVVFEIYHGYNKIFVIQETGGSVPGISPVEWLPSTEPPEVDRSTGLIYFLPYSPDPVRYRLSSTGIVADDSFYAGYQRDYTGSYSLAPNGSLFVTGDFSTWENHATTHLARLRTDVSLHDMLPPYANIGGDDNIARGENITLSAHVTGTGPFTYQWLALDGQPLPTDPTSPTLAISDVQLENLGRYQLRTSGPGGTTLSNVGKLAGEHSVVGLANLSGRAVPGDGERAMVAGFSVSRSAAGTPSFYMLRGVGPSLLDHGIAAPLSDPSLTVFSADAEEIAANDNWTSDSTNHSQIIGRSAQFGAFPLRDPSLDAAFQVGVQETSHLTVHLNKTAGDEGPALLEIYEIADFQDSSRPANLVNLSLRAHAGPGDATAVAGFVLTDPLGYQRPARVLVRAIGPSLSNFNITQPLPDPVMTLHHANGDAIATVDNWGDDSDADGLAATMAEVGAFALERESLDSALVLELSPGPYTLSVTDPEQRTGVVILEIYLVP
ncbi:immunoglobulin domain-containing protein [Synoicihabitans lomoniglobus]|uniref:Immunoglobulin domain-containing protein n=1 Tax=Synoicihabitans lomoniglobus TaxID=2909285 RepID=A0AAF0I3D7_9BACT|nr:immunoglobulin domain-containing protein [Opitutaceae bacterium LMO-M01]WED65850.1 immunoglobulin domain-containing protein [Opitutaceae bacterium LMO-M01]